MSFTLTIHRWYGFQMLPGYVGGGQCVPFCAPVFVQHVQPLKKGTGELEVEYFNPLYAEGVQGFNVRLKVLVRADGYLLAKLLEGTAATTTRTVVFAPVSFPWLHACCPDLLTAWPPAMFNLAWTDEVSTYLDAMYRGGGSAYERSGCTVQAEPEDEWLLACAVRFDGYLYTRCHGLPEQPGDVLDWFLRAPDSYRDAPFLMAAMFMIQRGLTKEGVRGKTSQGWRCLRELFLQLANQPVPDDYRHGSFYERWEREFRPRLLDGCQLVQRLHEAAHYGSHWW